MARVSRFGEMLFAGKRDQVIELANEHPNILPQIFRNVAQILSSV
jgi:hypothetical protein